MPEGYRRTLIRQIGQHAHSEIVGQLPEGNWISRAPTLERKNHSALPKCRTRPVTDFISTAPLRTLGISRDEMTEMLLDERMKYSSIFN